MLGCHMGDLVDINSVRKPNDLEPLWRDVVGRKLRDLRHEQGERLVETAARAGISPQYLSEVERGRKDPSSEMLAAIAGALGTSLVDLTDECRRGARRAGHPARRSAHAGGLAVARRRQRLRNRPHARGSRRSARSRAPPAR